MAAFLLYCLEIELLPNGRPQLELTLFTTAVQGVGYLIFMAVANLLYTVGRASEGVLHPRDLNRRRRTMFALGTAVCVATPMLVPILVFLGRHRS
ncbi:MAG: hypothetical protein ACYDCL_07240 [Myxococcales bacterium]